MPSFVKNEIEALQHKGINVRVVMLGQLEESKRNDWSSIVEDVKNTIYLSDEGAGVKHPIHFLSAIVHILRHGKLKHVIQSCKLMMGSSYSKSLAFYHLRYAMTLFRILSKYKPYRIHSHFAWGNAYIAAYIAKLLGVPFSLTVHADDIFALNEEKTNALKWLFSKCDRVITISNFNKDYLVNEGSLRN